ncbi:hypothetical protein PAUR_a0200 [Pseudoalteromonas aurantia 208]|uniref:Lipoprotein n=2 Tax=Pseudoalteromonas aurantia TaxID=43654 RepID=A0ABR9E9K7_9GAMM|nr:hypothetical protein [Pseudoalteromonas aurantia 208]
MNKVTYIFLIMGTMYMLYGCSNIETSQSAESVPKEVMALDNEINLVTEITATSNESSPILLYNALVFRLPASPRQLNNITAPYYLYLLLTHIDPDNAKHQALFKAYWANIKSYTDVKSIANETGSTLVPFILPVTETNGENTTSTTLMHNYNIPAAITMKAMLGESYEDETMMIVGSEVPLRLSDSSNIDTSKISVIGLSNYSQAEIKQTICKINKIVFREKYTGALTKKLRAEHINKHIRRFNLFLSHLGSLLINTAHASEQC